MNLTRDIGLKLTAFFLAVVLWLFVTFRGRSEIGMDIPVELKNIPLSLELVDETPKKIDIRVRGQDRILRSLRPGDINAYIDLSKANRGESYFKLQPKNINLPSSVVITKITPNTVKVRLEEVIKKTVVVMPIVIGRPETGYEVKAIEISPRKVDIEGPRSVVMGIYSIKTEPVDITGLREDLRQDINLDTGGRNIKLRREGVRINVIIGRRR